MTTASALGLRARGPLAALDAATRRAIVDRSSTGDATVRSRTTAIIARVREEGDAALVAFARDFDRVELPAIEVPRATWDAALAALIRGRKGELMPANFRFTAGNDNTLLEYIRPTTVLREL